MKKKLDWKETLGLITEEYKNAEKVTDESLSVGTILYMTMDASDGLILKDGYNTRNKFFIIIGFTSEGNAIGSLLINSNIDKTKLPLEYLSCQYPIKQENYIEVLDYNSYIDCSEIFEFTKERIKINGSVKGHLTSEDLALIIGFLKETETLSIKEKRKYSIIS